MVQVEVNKRKYLEHKIEELKKQIKGANKEIKNYTE